MENNLNLNAKSRSSVEQNVQWLIIGNTSLTLEGGFSGEQISKRKKKRIVSKKNIT